MINWTRQDLYHGKSDCGNFTITEVGRPELYKLPFQLFYKSKLIGSFATKEGAKEEAELQLSGQI